MEDDDYKKICETSKRKSAKFKKFHDKMKRKDFFALRMGQLQFVDWMQSPKTNYWHPKFKQKGVDMRIGLDIASITAKKLCSKIVLISGDTDIVPAMKIARKAGVHVYWYSMDDGRAGSNINLAMCLFAGKDIIVYKGEKTKEELWEKYYTQAPAQRRQPVKKYKIVRRA